MSQWEDQFALQLRAAKIKFKRQYKAIPGRRLSWDFHPHKGEPGEWCLVGPDEDSLVARLPLLVEIQGSIWVKGGHNTGRGLLRDYEKNNLATLAGYHTLFLAPEHIKDGRGLMWVQQYLDGGA